MADPRDLAVVRQGSEAVAEWRSHHPGGQLDLSQALLQGADLPGADLSGADLFGADLDGAHLEATKLDGANLTGASLDAANLARASLVEATLARASLQGAHMAGANLSQANLAAANLVGVDLEGANLREAQLQGANMDGAHLANASFAGADLTGADIVDAIFMGTDLARARLGSTSLVGLDLTTCRGLEVVEHAWHSFIGVDTLHRTLRSSGGRFAPAHIAFFTGAGVPRLLLDQLPLLFSASPLQFSPCLIAHSRADAAFAERLRGDLLATSVPTYLHQEPFGPGALLAAMDKAAPTYGKLLLVSSQNSLERAHVLHDIEGGLRLEGLLQQQRAANPAVDAQVLILLRLDDYQDAGWQHPQRDDVLRRPVVDFRGWQADPAVYQRGLAQLIAALRPR